MVARHFFSRGQAGLAMASLAAILCSYQPASAQPSRGGVITPPGRGATHDAITEQELRKEAAGTEKMHTLMLKKTSPVGDIHPDPQGSLLTSSLFLSDGQMFTVVPLGAVLNLPAAHRGHVVAKPEGTFTFWPNFLKQNGSWLSAKEVPLKMAKGDSDLAKAILRETSMDSHVVVSVYKGGPITILEPTPEAKAEAKAAKAAAAEAENSETKHGGKS
jgi:hypothetical protein